MVESNLCAQILKHVLCECTVVVLSGYVLYHGHIIYMNAQDAMEIQCILLGTPEGAPEVITIYVNVCFNGIIPFMVDQLLYLFLNVHRFRWEYYTQKNT